MAQGAFDGDAIAVNPAKPYPEQRVEGNLREEVTNLPSG
jgi:hypothetical protein